MTRPHSSALYAAHAAGIPHPERFSMAELGREVAERVVRFAPGGHGDMEITLVRAIGGSHEE